MTLILFYKMSKYSFWKILFQILTIILRNYPYYAYVTGSMSVDCYKNMYKLKAINCKLLENSQWTQSTFLFKRNTLKSHYFPKSSRCDLLLTLSAFHSSSSPESPSSVRPNAFPISLPFEPTEHCDHYSTSAHIDLGVQMEWLNTLKKCNHMFHLHVTMIS